MLFRIPLEVSIKIWVKWELGVRWTDEGQLKDYARYGSNDWQKNEFSNTYPFGP